MPHELAHPVAVFSAHRYGLIQPHGPVTIDSAVASGLALVSLPGWEPGFDEVWDLRFAGEFVIHPSDIGRLRELELTTREQLAGSRTVFITQGRPLLAYAARFYDRLVRPLGRSALAFRTVEEALRDLESDRIPVLGTKGGPLTPRDAPSNTDGG